MTAEILGKEVILNVTSSGHYCIPISREIQEEKVYAVKLSDMSKDEKYKTILKLHRQFAHPPKKRLVNLMKDAGVWQEEYEEVVEEINQKCDICKEFAKTPPRPVVGFPMASKFNEKVAMDLKSWNGKWILHIIDMWSRLTVSTFIDRKKTSEVIDKIMSNWISVYGVMGAIMTDNGGEFSSDEMREVASILNIEICTSAAESPFQNGLYERVHSITDSMLLKLKAENDRTSEQVLLGWANMARNSLQMWNGFSSHQLVFGENPNLPNIMNEHLPALEGRTSSEVLAKHLNALHASRRAFIQTEADERIRRALRGKVRAMEQVFKNGDRVFYKREGRDRWLGPGKVVFQDGKLVFVRHGGSFVRVSPNRLIKANSKENSKDDVDDQVSESKVNTPNVHAEVMSEELGSDTLCSAREQPIIGTVSKSQLSTNISLRANDDIKYKNAESEEWINVTVVGRAGKATGGNKSWYNIKHSNGKQQSIDLEKHQWKKIDSEDVNMVLVPRDRYNDEECISAKLQELEKLKRFSYLRRGT